MPERPSNYDQPNVGPRTGPDRIIAARVQDGSFFHRRGGKFVERLPTGFYQLGTAASSHLAGFIESEQHPHPMQPANAVTTDSKLCPINFGLEASHVIPTSGRIAVPADIGGDFNLVTAGNAAAHTLRQFINLGAGPVAGGVVRISEIVTVPGSYVACVIPPAVRLGNL